MKTTVSLETLHSGDDTVLETIARCLRSNGNHANQIRRFADDLLDEKVVNGITFQPQPGQILVCNFSLGFTPPEMVKVRPVMVVSPKTTPWTGLCMVVPISSKEPSPMLGHHYALPAGLVPRSKYANSWIKGDMVMTVGAKRLDRFKVGFRKYEAPVAPPEVLKAVRRCILHSAGMKSLTPHL